MAAPYIVSTRTPASSVALVAAIVVVAALAAAPAFASRGMVQDLFFILTMLTLAQFWNLLAGYGGLVSVGQQAFVGIGAYALYGAVILGGADPVVSILFAGLAALILAVAGFIPGLLLSFVMYDFVGGATFLPLRLDLRMGVSVFLMIFAMCAVAGLLAVRKLRDANPADMF